MKADKGVDDHLDWRKEEHIEFGIVNSATNEVKSNDNFRDKRSRL